MRGHYRTYFIDRKNTVTRQVHVDVIFMSSYDDTCTTVVGAGVVSISRQDVARALRRSRNATSGDTTFTVERKHYVEYCQKCKRT